MASGESTQPGSAVYREPVRFALLQQIPTTILCLLILDDGSMSRICGSAVLGFWLGTGFLLARRPERPSRTDLLFIRWGFLLLLVVAFPLTVICSRSSTA